MINNKPNTKIIIYLDSQNYQKVKIMLNLPYKSNFFMEYLYIYKYILDTYQKYKRNLINMTKNTGGGGSRSRYLTRYIKYSICNYDNYFFKNNIELYNIYLLVVKKLHNYVSDKQIIRHDLNKLLPYDVCKYIVEFY